MKTICPQINYLLKHDFFFYDIIQTQALKHPVTTATHSVTMVTHPVTIATHLVIMATHPVTIVTHLVTMATHSVTIATYTIIMATAFKFIKSAKECIFNC